MYDKLPVPGRNDACWCGSGKKYKKCHAAEDDRLDQLYHEGEEVLPRSLIKTAKDIEGIKASAAVNMGVLDLVGERICAGTTTMDINEWVEEYLGAHDAVSADLNFEGYPYSVCTSINDVVCHGFPNKEDVLKDGDIINVDMSTIKGGYFSDSSRMFCIGDVSPERKRLVDVCHDSVKAGLAAVKPWGHLGDVGAAVNKVCQDAGYSVVEEYGGHGIGVEFHEDPFVGFTTEAGTGPILMPGMCFTIEPMVNAGKHDITIDRENGWIVRTADGSDSAQWEVQLVVTDTGYELLSW
ncbi:MAG: methionyl aminopeptidase [Coriobacteriaceae bacterium]|jgi:methionyl aminopeptidase|nr:methionyl aminopeptidase [Olsenella sp.]MCI1289248.1 methionyl aminopeptidase [Olsenella sp.]RRF91143.1 MAG: methionyl aminopeptidase [Coriobacteriaceae bacterium]